MKNGKKKLFYAITALLPLTAFVLLEIGLRLFSFGDDLTLFVPGSDPNYLHCNPVVGKRFFNAVEYTTPLNDLFLKEKPANGYRIFLLGESTVLGFPYDANIAFSRILQRRLQDVFPHRTIEVINLGLTAVTSYTLLDFADELLQHQPDAVLIYAGHNEYYGALGAASMENGSIPAWLKKFQLKLVRLRTYQLLQRGMAKVYQLASPMSADEAKGTLMQRLVGRNLIPYHSPIYAEGLVQFDNNMSELLFTLKNAGVPVVMSDLVSNVRDLHPFRSSRYENYPDAESLYVNAVQLEARALFERAKEEYSIAKDLDQIRFRASEDLNRSITLLADSFGVHCISLKTLFEQNSPHGIVGDNLMTEHLHPNVDGYFLMAEGFFNGMREQRMIERVWDSDKIKPWGYYRSNWGFTELDSMIAVIRIKHLKAGWPFQPETTVNNFFFTYQPKGVVDSLAFTAEKYDNVTVETAHKTLAARYESAGDFKKASREYLSLAYASPENVSFYYYAADLAQKAGDLKNTIRYLKESPNSDTSSYVQFTLASIYSDQKNYTEALKSIDRLKKLRLDRPHSLLMKKLEYNVLKDSGLHDEAKQALAILKGMDPTFDESKAVKSQGILIPSSIAQYLKNAEVLRRDGKLSEAIALLKKANTVKEIPYTNLLIGKILIAQKDPDALRYLEKAHKELKDDPSLVFSLSLLYLMKDDFRNATASMDEFARLEGMDHPQYKQLKVLYEKQRKRKK